ncbi:hypothetical protein ES708_12837 [subsurface metagenome]
METAPILFMIFNRPDTTEKVFNKIRQVKPKKLYISADGPRKDRKDDSIKCQQAREIVSKIDWDCDVKTRFLTENMGCGLGPSTAIDWIFEHEDSAIILEDDCLPAIPFFTFCTELLERYKTNTRIMSIAGTQLCEDKFDHEDSYFFSRYQRATGWATWKRAWSLFDYNMKSFNQVKKDRYLYQIFNEVEADYWQRAFEYGVNSGDVWDYQWIYAMFINDGLTVLPKKNLISHIGVEDATHIDGAERLSFYDIDENFKISKHPKLIVRNNIYDTDYVDYLWNKKSFTQKVILKIKKLIDIKTYFPAWKK